MLGWVRTVVAGLLSLLVYVIAWQAFVWITLPKGAAMGHGTYNTWSPLFIVTGVLFVAFGLFLQLRG